MIFFFSLGILLLFCFFASRACFICEQVFFQIAMRQISRKMSWASFSITSLSDTASSVRFSLDQALVS